MSQSELNIKNLLKTPELSEPKIIHDRDEYISASDVLLKQSPRYPKFPHFESWLATYQSKYRFERRPFPDLMAERAALVLKTEFETHQNEIQHAEKRAREEAEVIEAVHRIIQDRIGFNSALLEFLKVESLENIQKYCNESLKMAYSSLKPMGDTLRVHLYSAAIEDLNLYKLLQYFVKTSLDNAYLFEFIYDNAINRCLTERANTSVNKAKDNPELEEYHLKKIAKLLKPFLHPGHEEFEKRFELHLNGKHDSVTASKKLVKYSKEMMQIIEKLNLRRKLHEKSLTKDFQISLERDLVQAEAGLKELLQNSITLPTVVEKVISLAKSQGEYQPTPENPSGLEIPQIFKVTKYCREIFHALNFLHNWLNTIDKILEEAIAAAREWELAIQKVRGKPIIPLSLDIPNFGGLRMMIPIPPEVLEILNKKANEVQASEHTESSEKDSEISDQAIIKLKDDSQDRTHVEAAAKLLEFKLKKEDELIRYQASVLEKRELKAYELQQRAKLLKDALIEEVFEEDFEEVKELQEYEALQLNYLMEQQKNLSELISDWFNGGAIKFSVFENMIKQISKGIIEFKPLEFQGSSHFSAYLPNSHKVWHLPSKLLFKQMSTVNSWKNHGAAHNSGVLSDIAAKRCLKGLIRAGITPERLKLATEKASKFKTVKKFA